MSSEGNNTEKRILELKRDFVSRKAHLYYAPVSMQQAATAVDIPAKGPAWASRVVLPAPGDDTIVRAISNAIKHLGNGDEDFAALSLADVKAQWSGYRPKAMGNEEEPDISEKEKYEGMMKDTISKTTMLYAHGGFYYTGSPAMVRQVTVALARLSGGRCLVVDHRLCPQNPFPAALVDIFIAYLSLLYPPAGSFHEAVPSEHIVLAGESSGGNLVFALLLLLQYLRDKQGGRIRFHDEEILVPLPAGIAAFGAHGDATSSFPSSEANAKYDWLVEVQPVISDKFPSCPLWPSTPPRGDIYCEISALTHPLVSPVASRYWKSMPPMFFAYGEEKLIDEGKFIAQRASDEGAVVQFHQYDRLCHVFALLFPKLAQSQHMFREWARFCHACVDRPASLKPKNIRYPVTDNDFKGVDNGSFSTLDYETVMNRMRERQAERKVWSGPTMSSML